MFDLLDRLADKFTVGDHCWEWVGRSRCGTDTAYGQTWVNGRKALAHRAVYELMVGPIPDGVVLDHLCRNRLCVRPHHLDPVPQRTNVLRGNTLPAARAAQTHCTHGHPFDAENTYLRPDNGNRQCRACQRIVDQKRRAQDV